MLNFAPQPVQADTSVLAMSPVQHLPVVIPSHQRLERTAIGGIRIKVQKVCDYYGVDYSSVFSLDPKLVF